MADSIFNGFMGRAFKREGQRQEKLSSELEKIRKGASEFNDNLETSIADFEELLKATKNVNLRRKVKRTLKKARKLKGVRSRLSSAGSTITSEEGQQLLSLGDEMTRLRVEVSKTVDDFEELDILKPFKDAGAKAEKVFLDNIEQISRSGLTSSASELALGAVSPEAAIISQSLGIDPLKLASDLFSSDEGKSEEVKALEEVKDSVESSMEVSEVSEKNEVKREVRRRADSRISNKRLHAQAEFHHREHMTRWDSFIGMFSLSNTALQSLPNSIADSVGVIVDGQIESTSLLISHSNENSKNLVKATKDIAETALTVSSAQHNDNVELLDKLLRAMGSMKKGMGDFLTAKGASAKGAISRAGAATAGAASAGGKAVASATSTIGPKALKAAKFLGKVSGVGLVATAVGGLLSVAFEDVNLEPVKKSLLGIGESLGIYINTMINKVKEKFTSIYNFFSEEVPLIWGRMSEILTQGVRDSLSSWRERTTNLFSSLDFFEGLSVTDVLNTTLKNNIITDAFKWLSDKISSGISEFFMFIETGVGDTLAKSEFTNTIRKKLGIRTTSEVKAEQANSAEIISRAKALGVDPEDLVALRSGEITPEEARKRFLEKKKAKAQESSAAKSYNLFNSNIGESSSRLESEISQSVVTDTVNRVGQSQMLLMKKQEEERVKAAKEESKSRENSFSQYRGRYSLDNIPKSSEDVLMQAIVAGANIT